MQRPHQARLRVCLLLAGIAGLVLLPAAAASAHGDEEVGDMVFVIGFGTEPAYAGQPNSVQLILSHDGDPVTDLPPDDLGVEVSFGSESTTLPLEPYFEVGEFGTPGDYRAWFVPSEPGDYTFHFTGTVDGEDVDVEMSSGADTFGAVGSLAESAFPPVDTPSTQELVDRIDQESQRTQAAQAAAVAAQAQIAAANDEANAASTTATVAVILGAIGVIAGIAGIAIARKKA